MLIIILVLRASYVLAKYLVAKMVFKWPVLKFTTGAAGLFSLLSNLNHLFACYNHALKFDTKGCEDSLKIWLLLSLAHFLVLFISFLDFSCHFSTAETYFGLLKAGSSFWGTGFYYLILLLILLRVFLLVLVFMAQKEVSSFKSANLCMSLATKIFRVCRLAI